MAEINIQKINNPSKTEKKKQKKLQFRLYNVINIIYLYPNIDKNVAFFKYTR